MRLIIPITVASALSTVFAMNNPPETIELIGTVRDFKERTEFGGHPRASGWKPFGFQHFPSISQSELNNRKTFVFDLIYVVY